MTSTFYVRSPWFEEVARDIFIKKGFQEIGENRQDCGKQSTVSSKVFLTDGNYRRPIVLDQNSCGSNIKNKIDGTNVFTDKEQFTNLLLNLQQNHWLPDSISMKSGRNMDKVLEYALTKYRFVIIKPTNGYGGKGVQVFGNHQWDVIQLIKHHIQNYPQYKTWIIQQYLYDPLLFRGRKFHLRMYILLLHTPEFTRSYFYTEGFIYSARTKYGTWRDAMNHLKDQTRHITNISTGGQAFIFPKQWDSPSQAQDIIRIIAKMCQDIICSAFKQSDVYFSCTSDTSQGATCYDILGVDVMINKNGDVKILELNSGVGFNLTGIDEIYKTKWRKEFFKDTINLVLDPNLDSTKTKWFRLC